MKQNSCFLSGIITFCGRKNDVALSNGILVQDPDVHPEESLSQWYCCHGGLMKIETASLLKPCRECS